MDLFNEFFLLVSIYHMMCFTPYVDDPNTRDWIGISLIACTSFNVILNLVILMFFFLKQSWFDLKEKYYKFKNRNATPNRADQARIDAYRLQQR